MTERFCSGDIKTFLRAHTKEIKEPFKQSARDRLPGGWGKKVCSSPAPLTGRIRNYSPGMHQSGGLSLTFRKDVVNKVVFSVDVN